MPDDDQSNDLEDCKVGGWDNPDFTEEGDKELEVVDFPLIDDDGKSQFGKSISMDAA